MKKWFRVCVFSISIFFISASRVEAFSCSSNGTGGGNFNAAGTWIACNNTTPQTTDSITINSADTVTLVAATAVTGITINNGGILAANTRTLTNTGGYTNNGSHTGTTSTMILNGPAGSAITGSGTYSPTGVVTISIADKTVSVESHLSFNRITITGVVLTNNSTLGFTVTTALAGTGQIVQGVNSVLNINGTSTITTLNASAVSNDVHYTSTTANQTIKTGTYDNLFIDKPGRTGTMSGTTYILGNLVSTAATTDFVASTVTVSGTTDIYGALKDQNNTGLVTFGGLLTIHSTGSWAGHPAEASNFTFHNGIQYDGGTFVAGNGNFTFDTNSQSLAGASAITIGKIVVTGIQLTNSNTSSVTIPTFLTGTGEFIQGVNSILNIGDLSTITTFTASESGNVVNYTGTVAQTVHAGTYQTLNISGNTSGSVDIAADTTINTALTLGTVILSTSANKIVFGPSASVTRTTGYVTGTAGKIFASDANFVFPIGDSVNYFPAEITLNGVSTTGEIDASYESDNTWLLVNDSLTFNNYTLILNSTDLLNMTITKKNSGNWEALSSSCDITLCTAVNLTSMGEFRIGATLTPVKSESTPIPTPTPSISPTAVPIARRQIAEIIEPVDSPIPPLFDVNASPLLLKSGRVTLLVIGPTFLIGSIMGILLISILRHRK